ncbi:MAG: hypothetical protein H6742_14835 [Alphaproteobacteria bacterium]|nr:hypothetical protein [Alphaproteobacteria bacterium]
MPHPALLALVPLLASQPADASCMIELQVVNKLPVAAGVATSTSAPADGWADSFTPATTIAAGGSYTTSTGVACGATGTLGHYTRVIWKKTTPVSCALVLDSRKHPAAGCRFVPRPGATEVTTESTYDAGAHKVTLTVSPKK